MLTLRRGTVTHAWLEIGAAGFPKPLALYLEAAECFETQRPHPSSGERINFRFGSIAIGAGQRSVQPCPLHPDRDRLQRRIKMT
jgi:hypothetical protein